MEVSTTLNSSKRGYFSSFDPDHLQSLNGRPAKRQSIVPQHPSIAPVEKIERSRSSVIERTSFVSLDVKAQSSEPSPSQDDSTDSGNPSALLDTSTDNHIALREGDICYGMVGGLLKAGSIQVF